MEGRTAAHLVIGNEILSGKIRDENTHALACELRGLGIELRRVVVVPDEIDAIAGEVNALRNTHDLLFTSGGVGPTHDDVTLAGIARAFGRRLVRHAGIESLLRHVYAEHITDDHLRMADVVEGTELWPPPERREWPAFLVGNVCVLPGVPELYRAKLLALRPKLRGSEVPFVLHTVYTRGDEGNLRVHIDAVVAAYPDVMIGSYPSFRAPDHSVRVTFDARDGARSERAARDFAALVPAHELVRIE